ncbi:type IV pilus biogenesis protein PilM, partial [Escherichia coli]|uniref:type IV pilus biogenesis protein PilM n=1 Tax=Escherichia coli TaxID=562 RepID=UPI0012D1947E
AIRKVLDEAKIKTKNCVITIPDFLTFFTTFDLPKMSKEELPEAIKMEARKYIPLPIKDVSLDWRVIEKGPNFPKENKLTILTIAIPHEIINKCQQI